MNTDTYYERRTDRARPDLPDPAVAAPNASPLAIHGDPSQARTTTGRAAQPWRHSITWVRPSELPTMVGAPWIGRGAELQAEMARRARRAPATATSRAGRRITRTAIGRPQPPGPAQEGLSL
ncbi:MAG: hypothetical protein ACTHOK_12645 [Nocardioidaceae bacterium]